LTRVGSLTEFAGGDLVVIRPPDGKDVTGPVLAGDPGAKEILRLDIQQLQSRGPTSNIDLRDGDTVVVPRAETIFVNGQVNAPGRYTYERDMTILMAISKANGINELGSTRRIKIIRIVDGKRTELKAAQGDKVLPGDTVFVGNRWF
jgi:polysaccharide export outer membrane protein